MYELEIMGFNGIFPRDIPMMSTVRTKRVSGRPLETDSTARELRCLAELEGHIVARAWGVVRLFVVRDAGSEPQDVGGDCFSRG